MTTETGNSTDMSLQPTRPLPAQILGRGYISQLPNEILLPIIDYLMPKDVRQMSQTCCSFYTMFHVPRPPKQQHIEFPSFRELAAPGDWSYARHRAIRHNPAWENDMKQYIWLCPHRTRRMRDTLQLKSSSPIHVNEKQAATYNIKACEHLRCRDWVSHTLSRGEALEPARSSCKWFLKTRIAVMKIHLPQGIDMPRMFDPVYLPTHASVVNYLLHNLQELAHLPICPHLSISHSQVMAAVLPDKILEHAQDSIPSAKNVVKCHLCEVEFGAETHCWWSSEVKQATRCNWAQMQVSLNIVRGLAKTQRARSWEREHWIDPAFVKPDWSKGAISSTFAGEGEYTSKLTEVLSWRDWLAKTLHLKPMKSTGVVL